MATPYEIDISMSPATVSQLQQGAFSLYAFKAAKTSNGGASPVIWFKTDSFMQTTKVKWTEQYQAYVSRDTIIPNGQIQASSSIDIDLDQTATVDGDGNLTVTESGTALAISVLNGTATPWPASGISQMANGVANPMIALPLHGQMLEVIVPIEKVLLLFATVTFDTGTVIYQTYSPGVLVDLTTAEGPNPTRAVHYDIDKQWDWGNQSWARAIPPQEDLVPLLIQNH
jgi:hypothetical protein